MKELRRGILVVFALLLVGVIGVPMCCRLAKGYAQEEEREGEIREEPAREVGREEGREREPREEREREVRLDKEAEREQRKEREPQPKFVSDEAYRLIEEAGRLKAEGKREAALELLEKAERIEAETRERKRREQEERETEQRFPADEVRRLIEKAERLAREGRREEAEELRGEAKRIWGRIREMKERKAAEARETKRREKSGDVIREHLQMAKRVKKEGREEAAEELIQKARAIQRGLRPEPPREREVAKWEPRFQEEPASPQRILGEIAELRRDVNRLREELADARELLRRLIEREQFREQRGRGEERGPEKPRGER